MTKAEPHESRWPSKATTIEEIRKLTGTVPMSAEEFDLHFGSLPTDGEG